jgi:hypothetical protein
MEEPMSAGKTLATAAMTQIKALEVRPRDHRTWAAPPLELKAEHEAGTSVGGGAMAGEGADAASGGDGGELRRGDRPLAQGREWRLPTDREGGGREREGGRRRRLPAAAGEAAS